jgi:replicative DNA helicase
MPLKLTDKDILIERAFLARCFSEPEWIDRAVSRGVFDKCFTGIMRRSIWNQLVGLRTSNQPCTPESIQYDTKFSNNNAGDLIAEVMECTGIEASSIFGARVLDDLLWKYRLSTVGPAINSIMESLERGDDKDHIVRSISNLPSLVADDMHVDRKLSDIVKEAQDWARAKAAGIKTNCVEVLTGIPSFDRYATPIQPHEYVVVCARTSVGKSSLMAQMAGYNLDRGLRVAYFTIESSDRSVVQQIASQKAGVNLRFFYNEPQDKQTKYFKCLEDLSEKALLISDSDTTLSKIESRCRMLAQSFKPDIVFIDYLNIISNGVSESYEKMSSISEAMISLKKTVGCTLIAGAQLNRGNEREDRRPERSDLRDSGSLEEDAHRIIALHRPKKDRNGIEQELDKVLVDYELLQLKLRDGPLSACKIKFDAPHTRFMDDLG